MKSSNMLGDENAQLEEQVEKVKSFFIAFTGKVLSMNSHDTKAISSDLTFSQIKTLSAFREDRDYTMGELSKNLGVATPRMTLLIDAFEERKIAKRVRDKKDKRVVKVRLTARGKGLLMKFMGRRKKETAAMLKKLSNADRKILINSFDNIIHVLEKLENI